MSEKPAESLRRKWIEPVVAVLMALTTLCTAWCSYESAAWTRRSNRLMNESNALERQAALLDVLLCEPCGLKPLHEQIPGRIRIAEPELVRVPLGEAAPAEIVARYGSLGTI